MFMTGRYNAMTPQHAVLSIALL